EKSEFRSGHASGWWHPFHGAHAQGHSPAWREGAHGTGHAQTAQRARSESGLGPLAEKGKGSRETKKPTEERKKTGPASAHEGRRTLIYRSNSQLILFLNISNSWRI